MGQNQHGNAPYRASVNGILIGYKLIGSGEPLLMIMGIANTMERWPKVLLDELSKNNQLILFDNRGVGFSSDDHSDHTYKLYAKDIIGLLDILKITKVNIFGVSMGGGIALELLQEHPHRINKAIICSATIDGSRVAEVLKGKAPLTGIAQKQLKATLHWKASLEKLSQISNPTLIVIGTSDTVVGVESSKILASTIPEAQLQQFNATHLLIDEFPLPLARAVNLFLIH